MTTYVPALLRRADDAVDAVSECDSGRGVAGVRGEAR